MEGYLICEECGGYYELLPGESQEDFESCQCGGELKFRYTINNDHIKNEESKKGLKEDDEGYSEKKISYYNSTMHLGLILCLIGIILFIGFIIFTITGFLVLSFIIVLIGGGLVVYGDNERRSWNKGIIGENIVTTYLSQLPKDYFIFNDVKFPGSFGNLDHIVMGPRGIFVIETKNYNGFYIVRGENWYYETRKYPKRSRSQPGKQVRRNARSLRKFLIDNDINLEGIKIDSIVTLVNNNFKIERRPTNYNVLYPAYITDFIQLSNRKIPFNILKEAALLIEPYSKKNSHSDYEKKRVHKNSFMPVLPGFGWKKF